MNRLPNIYSVAIICILLAGCVSHATFDRNNFFNKDSSNARHSSWQEKPIGINGNPEPHYLRRDRPVSGRWEGNLLQLSGEVDSLTLSLTIDASNGKAAATCILWLPVVVHLVDMGVLQDNSNTSLKITSLHNEEYYVTEVHLTGNVTSDSLFLQRDSASEKSGVPFEDHWRVNAKCLNLDVASDSTYPKVYLMGQFYRYNNYPCPRLGTFVMELMK